MEKSKIYKGKLAGGSPSSVMKFFLFWALVSTCYAQSNLEISMDVGGSVPPITSPQVNGFNGLNGPYQHVIFLSVDGLHQVIHSKPRLMLQADLATYVAMNPQSNFALLLQNAVWYNNTRGSMPTDSFPGTAAIYTGALPRTHGIWYDDVWDRSLFPASANCTGTPGY